MRVPRLSKIIINMGVGQATQDQKILEEAVKDLETITVRKHQLELRKSYLEFQTPRRNENWR